MREVVDLRVAVSTILWDQMVMMPPGGAAAKARQSTPEPGLAILTMGKRDVSYDIDLPMPRWHVRGHGTELTRSDAPPSWRIHALNDQHAFLHGDPETLPAIGDRIGCAISHPCTTFDKWRVVLMVDDDYRVVESLTTWF